METTTEEKIKQLDKEKRELRAQVMQEKEEKKRARLNKIKLVEETNRINQIGINKILKVIYLYNKLPKNKRYEYYIFKEIFDLIKNNTEEVKQDGEREHTESSE